MSVHLLATLDTKGLEAAFVRDALVALGVPTTVVDTGCLGEPAIPADIPRAAVFQAAGTTLEAARSQGDRGHAVSSAALGAARIIQQRHTAGEVSGILALGGSAGTTIGTAAMRALPLGVPKLMVSTLASGQTRPYVGDKDILMLNAVVDILGINRISRLILTQAARAMAGMVLLLESPSPPLWERAGVRGPRDPTPPSPHQTPNTKHETQTDKPLIAATMFGVTTPCVMRAKEVLEQAGYEVLVFHATGAGGQAMESLIADGLIAGVLDITTTELADELVGGVLSAGPDRLTAAGKRGIPQVISVGALDMVNFGPRDTVPEKFRGRLLHQHNANITLMRTTPEENAKLGAWLARAAAAATGPTAILLPLQGVSAIDKRGQPFDSPPARAALFAAIRQGHGQTDLVELDQHINDPAFAEAAANKLLELLRR